MNQRNTMRTTWTPWGVCTESIAVEIENGSLKKVEFGRGICSGNGQAVVALVQGMPAAEVVKKLKGIRCNRKSTSCPDQLAQAIEKALETDVAA